MNTHYELKVKDAFGDVWTTGHTFPTLKEAKAFINDPAKLKERQAARRSAESFSGARYSKENPISWQVDEVTLLGSNPHALADA